jgi:hypothetical protein
MIFRPSPVQATAVHTVVDVIPLDHDLPELVDT